jgi:hypothetical protein
VRPRKKRGRVRVRVGSIEELEWKDWGSRVEDVDEGGDRDGDGV